jgi:branched-chain amino acid transport system substrate-binding protein
MQSMTSWITRFAFLCVVGCANAQTPIIVGAVITQTGAQAPDAEGYRAGLRVWEDEVNAAGGLLGRKVELRLLDDGSNAIRNGALYEQLIQDEHADLLIGPFGTAATLLAAAVAERSRRVMINGAGPGGNVHKRLPRYVFQTGIPYKAYGPVLRELLQREGISRLYILARDDTASKEMAESLRALTSGEIEIYGSDVLDFTPLVKKAQALNAEAWIAFGGTRDAADMVRTFHRLNYAPRLFFARAASDPKFPQLVGQDAEFTLTSIEYDARLATPGNDQFVKAFTAKWNGAPDKAAADGYAAGTVLAAAVRQAGTLDQERLRRALGAIEVDTVLGRQKMNPAGGDQMAARPALAQIFGGRPAPLPKDERSAPYPAWSERKVIR